MFQAEWPISSQTYPKIDESKQRSFVIEKLIEKTQDIHKRYYILDKHERKQIQWFGKCLEQKQTDQHTKMISS